MKMSAEADPRPLGFGKSSAVRLTRSKPVHTRPPCKAVPATYPGCAGVDLMRHPKYNKARHWLRLCASSEVLPYILPQGLAFSDSERDRLYLRGLLPPVTLSQEVQLERTLLNIRSKATNLEKLMYMQGLQGVAQLAAGSVGLAGTGRPAGSAGSSGCGGPAESVVLPVKTPQIVAQLAAGSVGQRRVVAQQAEQRCLSGLVWRLKGVAKPEALWGQQGYHGVGLAFSDSERDRLYLRGLLPPVTLSQEVQLERTLLNIRSKATNLEKLMYMQGLQGVAQLAAGSVGLAGTGRPAGSAGSSGCGGPAESVVLPVKTPQIVAQLAAGSVGQRRVVAQQAEQRCLSGLVWRLKGVAKPEALWGQQGYHGVERNERLFYRVLCESFDELMPVMSMPVVRDSCRKYGLMFKSVPRALFITLEDRGRVFRILKNWPERNVQLVVVTDGERTGSAGDLGVQAVGVPISKLAMYTACGGINPAVCLPVVIDTGTDNEELLESPFYVGSRHRRIRGDPYYELLDEFLVAIKRRYGNTTLLQFEDMTFDNATKLLNMYRTEFPCFNDAMSASAASVLACMMAAMPRMGGKLADQTFMFSGDSGNVTCMAELLATAIAQQTNQTVLEARRKIWLVDAHGLVTRERGDSCSLEGYKLPFCHSGPTAVDLAAAVDLIKPTVLVGFDCSPTGAHFKFDQRASGCAMALHGLVCTAMASHTARPLLLALTSEDPEVQPADAYAWTQGRALLACGDSGGGQVTLAEGHTLEPSQCTPHYIFPGVGLGVMISKCTKLRDEQFIAAAEAVTRMVGEDEARRGALLPPLKNIREVAVSVARAVAQKAYEGGYATALPKPHNLAERARQFMYSPLYRRYR
ncbi:hypothetical protein QJQ45_023860 [Haematococcus lacustris]|nr:hypothetical protein QJQ45_023860 [Haematococcus lacustris]